jgi:hypothetical protein
MAVMFKDQDPRVANPTEARVAEVLLGLPDSWLVRWGYFYESQGRGTCEGDFLILGPDGRLLVLEVKGGQNRHFVLTGEWEHAKINPHRQLLEQWKAAINHLQEVRSDDDAIPFVGKALCLPHVNLVEADRLTGELGRGMLVLEQDLKNFPAWWQEYLSGFPTHSKNARKLFHAAFAPALQPARMELFIRQTDRLFERFKAMESEVLDMAADNRQLFIEGGVGSGKTFLALQQAVRYAEAGDGQHVLMLCYNLLLAERMKRMVALLKPACGTVVVRSWQELLGEILAVEGLSLDIPEEREAQSRYFKEELPGLVNLALAEGKVAPAYDALVVDEAQDHDTAGADQPVGWWSWYFRLLKEGTAAPVTLLYDRAQRPAFRGPELFDDGILRSVLSQPAKLTLRRTLRYTGPVFRYLEALEGEGVFELKAGLQAHQDMPTGPAVEVVPVATREEVARAAEGILRKWTTLGFCKPTDCILIGPSKWMASSSLAKVDEFHGKPLADYDEALWGKVGYIGAHRSKGMDFLAVIVIDYEPFAKMDGRDRREGFFIAASRARQLLGVVTVG